MALKRASKFKPILGGFIPLAALWDEGATGPLFPSEPSARWFVRTNRSALVEAQAIAIHAKRMLIHPDRFQDVATRVALDHAKR